MSRIPCLFACARYTYRVVSRLRVCSQLSLSDPFLSSACRAEHICILTGQIVDRVQRSVIRIVNCWISEQSSRVRKSSRVGVHQHASSLHKYNKKKVAEQVLQSTECLGRKDRNLPVLIQLTCSCQEEQVAIAESSRHHNRNRQHQ